MRLQLATANAHKVAEVSEILSIQLPQLELVGYQGPSPAEVGATFNENALIKARAAFQATGIPTIADDSGVCVEIMGGAPGIFSAIWSGKRDDAANLQLLLAQLEEIPEQSRGAAYVCSVALVDESGECCFTGIWSGAISTEPAGSGGFGYDSIFIPDGFVMSAAQLDSNLKNVYSHRALALSQLASFLVSRP